jgi:protein involved in polysaccharide export with SLBB domain
VIAACLVGTGSVGAAQQPTTEQIQRALQTRPDVSSEVRQRIASSGLTAEQIRTRLVAAGYPAGLLDGYLPNAPASASPAPDNQVFAAVRALGLAGEAEAAELSAAAQGANRAGEAGPAGPPSEIFGLDVFRRGTSEFQPSLTGPVDPGYRLGPGDLLVLVLTGDVEASYQLEVTREGFIVIPQIGQLQVAGMTLESLETTLYARLGRAYSGVQRGPDATTRFQVSVARLRMNQVFVVGDVERPGSYLIPGAGTALTGLYAAGGPTPNGSLRRIMIRRGGRILDSLDVYNYLLRGDTRGNLRLESGDVIFVPVRGLHVRISGEILRPRIYELTARETLRDLLRAAGGFTPTALRRIQVDRVLPPGQRQPGGRDRVVLDLPAEQFADGVGPAFELQGGDEVTVFAIAPRRREFVTVQGNVWTEGRVGYTPGMRMSEALRLAGGAKPDTYLGQVLLSRLNADSTRTQLRTAFRDSTGALTEDLPLREDDEIRIFSRVAFRPDRWVTVTGAVRSPGRIAWREGMTMRDAILLAQGVKEEASLREAEIARMPADRSGGALAMTMKVPLDSTYLVDRGPDGRYLGPPGEPGQRAGAAEEPLQPYDNVLIFRQPDWELQRLVTITGQVRYPGTYSMLRRDERLAHLIARAGGLATGSYPEGIRFYRPLDPRSSAGREVVGGRTRLAVDLPKALADTADRNNLILTAGDSVHIPEYSPMVLVTGAVNAPSGVTWRPGQNVDDAVRAAGGYSRMADTKRAYVQQPSGEVLTVSRKFLLPDGVPKIQPGATVVVPERDPNDRKDHAAIWGAVASVLASTLTIIVVLVTQ